MTRKPKPPPARSRAGLDQAREREARLADALRDNLLRRKAQRRGRAEAARPGRSPEPPKDGESAGRKP